MTTQCGHGVREGNRTGELGTQQRCQRVAPLEKLALGVWDQRRDVQRHRRGAETETLELDGASRTCYQPHMKWSKRIHYRPSVHGFRIAELAQSLNTISSSPH